MVVHLRGRERHKGGEGRETDRQTREMGRVRRERTSKGREGWKSRETSREEGGGQVCVMENKRETGGKKGTEREKGVSSQHFNRVGLAFRWSGLRADGLKTHCGSHISKLNVAH